jgi:hypothetical protein
MTELNGHVGGQILENGKADVMNGWFEHTLIPHR